MFGFIAADATAVNNMATLYLYTINLIEQSRSYTKQLTGFKDLLSVAPAGTTLGTMPVLTPGAAPALTVAGIFTTISGMVQRIKGNTSKYTEAIGMDLGIIGDETTFDADNFIPAITGKPMPGQAIIGFTKHGIDGVNVYSHAVGGDQTLWVKLAYDGHSPYIDTRPLAVAGQPEHRQYKIRGVIHDLEIGQWSDVVSVTFAN